ncbi:hypothetical protein ABZS63_18745, partial [Streptomyces sp. NPDC005568]
SSRTPRPTPSRPPRSTPIRSGDVRGVQGLRVLAEQAQADANIDLAAEIWRILAESLAAGDNPRHATTAN